MTPAPNALILPRCVMPTRPRSRSFSSRASSSAATRARRLAFCVAQCRYLGRETRRSRLSNGDALRIGEVTNSPAAPTGAVTECIATRTRCSGPAVALAEPHRGQRKSRRATSTASNPKRGADLSAGGVLMKADTYRPPCSTFLSASISSSACAEPSHDVGERALRDVHGHAGLVPEPLVEALEQRAAAGEHDAVLHEVARQLGRRLLEGALDRRDDRRQSAPRPPRGSPRTRELMRARQAGEQVAAADLDVDLLEQRATR